MTRRARPNGAATVRERTLGNRAGLRCDASPLHADRSRTLATPFVATPLCVVAPLIAACVLLAGCSSGAARPPAAQPATQAQPTPSPPSPARPTPDDQARLASVVEGVTPWEFDAKPGKIITTANYRIFTTERDAITVDRAPRFLELALDHYRAALTDATLPAPPIRLDTFLMDNRAQWKSAATQMLGASAQPYLAIPRGGFATGGRAFLYDIGVFDTLAIAAHEGWHQYTQRAFADPLPIWLEEGVATFMEGHKWNGASPVFLEWANIERFDQLRLAHSKGELLTLERLLNTAPQDLILHAGDAAVNYYAQVWALTHFLADRSHPARRAALASLLADFAAGRAADRLAAIHGRQGARPILMSRRGDAVFRAYFGEDFEKVASDYAAYVAALVRPGSRGPIVAGASPFSP